MSRDRTSRHRSAAISKRTLEQLSEFRYQLRRFERFSERAARAHGVTPLQYLLLLHIKGYPGREYANVGELAERLQAQPHAVVALINRCEKRGLVRRRASARDGREVEVHLLEAGEHLLLELAALHRRELKSMRAILPLQLEDS
jgi:DNA-binding MarR family transcriptional regulator